MKRYRKRIQWGLSAALAFSLLSLPARALADSMEASTEHGASAGGIELLLPNLGEFIPMLIGFVLLWLVLAKFGWPVILDMLDKRVNTIRDNLAAAEASRLESAELLEQQKVQLTEARNQAAQIIADAKIAGEAARADIEAQAAKQADAMLARARQVIEGEKQAAMIELHASVADLTVALAGRLIATELDDKDHRRIIESYISQAGSFDVN